jgi:hypothetical protein
MSPCTAYVLPATGDLLIKCNYVRIIRMVDDITMLKCFIICILQMESFLDLKFCV